MNVYIDDVEANIATNAEQLLDDVLQAAREQVDEAGRMIVGLVCDGIDVPDAELAATLQKPQSEFQRVDLHSADPVALVREALDQAEQLLNETARSAKGIVEQLTCGNTADAMPILSSCCQAWLEIHGGVSNAMNALKINPESVEVNGKPIVEVLGEPIRVLNDIKEAVTARDFVLLSDILSYEFEEAAEGWRGIINAVRQMAGGVEGDAK
ncbi:MAG: hypothetical protein DHS20C16_08890 [Phycisphaerae bacterium]|nr:MAG: hypothetical protein DHS20C16_08890 [Phycisphaerae bacterium]